jgi:predicted enzyme related to lactoylglutathione lyase
VTATTTARTELIAGSRDLDAEVAPMRALGATPVTAEPMLEDGWTWHILADPDGNEFCVVQPDSDYWDTPS